MPLLTLPGSLAKLLPENERPRSGHGSVLLVAGSWAAASTEIRNRYPMLAQHVLDDDGELVRGFLLAVNDDIVQGRPTSFDLSATDELCIIAQLAGG